MMLPVDEETNRRRLAVTNPNLLDDDARADQRVAVQAEFEGIVEAAQVGHENDCPECQNGKHQNCAGWAIDEETDAVVDCTCAEGGHP